MFSDWAPSPTYIQIYTTGSITPTVKIKNTRKRYKKKKTRESTVKLEKNNHKKDEKKGTKIKRKKNMKEIDELSNIRNWANM